MPPTTVTINGLRANPGDHICAFYRGRAERDRLVLPFLREGLIAGDKCICITAADDHQRLESALLDGAPEVDRELLRLEHYERTYLKEGSFRREHIMAYWTEWGRDTFEVEGHAFGRAATDMTWVADNPSVLNDFLDYEVEATRVARAYPQVALCLYDLEHFRGNVIIPVLKAHPKVLFSQMILENPYYVDPDELSVRV